LLSVSPDNAGFRISITIASPVIERLTPNRAERMNHVRARLLAEHDIASDRRRTRGAPPGGGAPPPQDAHATFERGRLTPRCSPGPSS
jgi:hypothetical protein